MMNSDLKILTFPDPDTVREEAALWVARMDTAPLEAADEIKYRAWLAQSPLPREAIEERGGLWRDYDILEELNRIESVEADGFDKHSGKRSWTGSRIVGGIAACAALIMISLIWPLQPRFTEPQTATYSTRVGSQELVALFDGSTMTLNTDTVIAVTMTRHQRVITLLKGEAHFDVAEDSDRPFLVEVAGSAIKAVGTAFSVHLHNGEIEVLVLEGIVELLGRREADREGQAAANIPPAGETRESLTVLAANDRAVFDSRVRHVEKMTPLALNRQLLWRDGMVGFSGEPLSAVIAEMSRYTDIHIEIRDADIAHIPIGGRFPIDDINGLFEALDAVFEVDVQWLAADHVLLTRNRQNSTQNGT